MKVSELTRQYGTRLLVLFVAVGSLWLAACRSDAAAPATPTPAAIAVETEAPAPFAFPEVVPLDQPLEAPSGVPDELKTVWEVWTLLTSEHVDRAKLDPAVFTEATLRLPEKAGR